MPSCCGTEASLMNKLDMFYTWSQVTISLTAFWPTPCSTLSIFNRNVRAALWMRKHLRLFIRSSSHKEVRQVPTITCQKACVTLEKTTIVCLLPFGQMTHCYWRVINIMAGFACFRINSNHALPHFLSLRCDHVCALLVQCVRHGQKWLHTFRGKVVGGGQRLCDIQTLQISTLVELWAEQTLKKTNKNKKKINWKRQFCWLK